MGFSHYEVVHRFSEGKASTGKNVYSCMSSTEKGERLRLFSYGHHFILAVKLDNPHPDIAYIVNGDKYSVSTSKHQSIAIGGLRSVQIPFSVLNRARIPNRDMEQIRILDYRDAQWRDVEYTDENGEKKIRREHLLGATLIRYGRRYYLSGVDESAKSWGQGYFLVRLPRPVKTVNEAYEVLKPVGLPENTEYQRQGEFFFVPTGLSTRDLQAKAPVRKPKVKKYTMADVIFNAGRIKADVDGWEKVNYWVDGETSKENTAEIYLNEYEEDGQTYIHAFSLTHDQLAQIGMPIWTQKATVGQINKQKDLQQVFGNGGNAHTVRDIFIVGKNEVYARGSVRHSEHKMVNLGEVWHRVYINNAIESFNAEGNVD